MKLKRRAQTLEPLAPIALFGALIALCALAAALPARANVVQSGTLRVKLSAALLPKRLPRHGDGPVDVSISSRFSTTDGSVPPPLKTVRIELNRQGRLETAGLPECRADEIQPASTARALRACRPALVGRGVFSIDAVLGGQEPYPTTGHVLLFNAAGGALLGQIYAAHPFANSFVVPFRVQQLHHGTFGIVLSARLPAAFTSWGHITGLSLHLGRRYGAHGARHSFLSAGCPAPKGVSLAPFPMARVSFGFARGQALSQTLTGVCRARG